jgi:hypothetical protein
MALAQSERFEFRLAPDLRRGIEEAARMAGVPVSEWIRAHLQSGVDAARPREVIRQGIGYAERLSTDATGRRLGMTTGGLNGTR